MVDPKGKNMFLFAPSIAEVRKTHKIVMAFCRHVEQGLQNKACRIRTASEPPKFPLPDDFVAEVEVEFDYRQKRRVETVPVANLFVKPPPGKSTAVIISGPREGSIVCVVRTDKGVTRVHPPDRDSRYHGFGVSPSDLCEVLDG